MLNLNDMGPHRVRTFVPWLCLSTLWWWLRSNRNMSP